MTDQLRAAAEAALEALVEADPLGRAGTIQKLRAALAEQDAEPVAWMDRHGDLYKMPEIEGWAPPHTMLYAHLPRRKWVGLTDKKMRELYALSSGEMRDFYESIEDALREQNGA